MCGLALKPVGFDSGKVHIAWALRALSWQSKLQAVPVHSEPKRNTAEFLRGLGVGHGIRPAAMKWSFMTLKALCQKTCQTLAANSTALS